MPSSKITLYSDAFWISPWVFTAFVALREKGIDFDVKDVGLHRGDQTASSYQASTVTGRVPAIEDGGFWLAESMAILEYLEEKFPAAPRVWPKGLEHRARARQLSSWIRSQKTFPISDERPTHTMFYERAKAPLSGEARAAVTRLLEIAGRVVQKSQPNLFDAWCITDAELAFLLQRLILNGEDVPNELRAYADAQWKRPSVHEWVTHDRMAYVPY